MIQRARIRLLVLAVLVPGLAWSAPPAENKFRLKPGAKGTLCLDCHVDFQDTLKLPHVHTPVKAGDCSDCHNPHASSHGKLLAEEPVGICLECHQNVVPAQPKSVHPAAQSGECVKCHDPHASSFKNNLLGSGSEFCGGCHEQVVRTAQSGKFRHSPVESGCLTCHTPHASASNAHLLTKGEPDLCVGCHRPDQPAFSRQHAGYPVARGRCTSCHNPHGSDRAGLLWANVHQPVANRMCGQCHLEPSSPRALEAKRPGLALCRGCHNDTVNTVLASSRIHWPVVDRAACLNCHSPHASPEGSLLAGPMKTVCGSCHQDAVRRQERSLVKHPPVQEGNCTACHSPHSAESEFLFNAKDTLELCGMCHDWQKHSSHPIGDQVVDMRNKNLPMSCLSCHRTHGTEFKYLAHFDPKADLCVQCHEDFRR